MKEFKFSKLKNIQLQLFQYTLRKDPLLLPLRKSSNKRPSS